MNFGPYRGWFCASWAPGQRQHTRPGARRLSSTKLSPLRSFRRMRANPERPDFPRYVDQAIPKNFLDIHRHSLSNLAVSRPITVAQLARGASSSRLLALSFAVQLLHACFASSSQSSYNRRATCSGCSFFASARSQFRCAAISCLFAYHGFDPV